MLENHYMVVHGFLIKNTWSLSKIFSIFKHFILGLNTFPYQKAANSGPTYLNLKITSLIIIKL